MNEEKRDEEPKDYKESTKEDCATSEGDDDEITLNLADVMVKVPKWDCPEHGNHDSWMIVSTDGPNDGKYCMECLTALIPDSVTKLPLDE